MKTLNDFLPYIHPDIPTVPRGLMLQYIMEALQDLAKIRGSMIEHLNPLHLDNDEHYVTLDDSYYYDEPFCVQIDGITVPRLPETCHMNALTCNRFWYLAGDDDQTGGDQLWFQGLSKRTTRTPRMVFVTIDHKEPNPDRVPDYIFRDYRMAIRHYVLWYILQMPGKSWTNQTLANQVHRAQWYIERRSIKSKILLRMYGNAPRVQVPLNDWSVAGRGSTFGSGGTRTIRGQHPL